jgi:ferredoxin
MKNLIYYFSGTGNSLWTARKLAAALGETGLRSLADPYAEDSEGSGGDRPDILGLVFPVYIWGVPAPVLRFLDTLKKMDPEYLFAVAVNAGQVANTLVELERHLAGRDMALSAGFGLVMPSNYIPWGEAEPEEKQRQKFATAEKKIGLIADAVRSGAVLAPERGPLWQRVVFSLAHKISAPHIPKMDKSFFADEKCTSCGICERICPADNIVMTDGRPVWNGRCEQCFACLQWCPEEAIQFGKKTKERRRYHHPEVRLEEMLGGK